MHIYFLYEQDATKRITTDTHQSYCSTDSHNVFRHYGKKANMKTFKGK